MFSGLSSALNSEPGTRQVTNVCGMKDQTCHRPMRLRLRWGWAVLLTFTTHSRCHPSQFPVGSFLLSSPAASRTGPTLGSPPQGHLLQGLIWRPGQEQKQEVARGVEQPWLLGLSDPSWNPGTANSFLDYLCRSGHLSGGLSFLICKVGIMSPASDGSWKDLQNSYYGAQKRLCPIQSRENWTRYESDHDSPLLQRAPDGLQLPCHLRTLVPTLTHSLTHTAGQGTANRPNLLLLQGLCTC